MADERPSDDQKIEEILTDLDHILSDLGDADAGAAQMVQMAPPPAEPPAVIPPPAVVTPPPAPAPAPAPAPVPKTPYAKPQPGAVPVPTPAPKPAPAAPPKPAPVVAAKPAPVEPPKPAPASAAVPPATPAPQKPSGPLPPSGANTDLKIELAPREGTLSVPKKEATLPPKKTPGLPPTRPPLEISLDAPAEPAPPKVEPLPKPAPTPTPAPAKASEPPPPEVANEDGVPPEAPPESVRRVAALYLAAYAPKVKEFFDFLAQSAQTVSKKPLFLRRALLLQIDAQTELPGIIGRVQDSKAVSVLGIIEGMPEERRRSLAAAFKEAKIDFREVAPDDMLKRSAAVDVLVEIMLLPSEL